MSTELKELDIDKHRQSEIYAQEQLERLDENDAERQDAEFSLEYTSGLVSVEDDINTPAFTIRAVVLGCIWGVFLAVANTVGSFRANAFALPTNIASILSYPMGLFLASTVPDLGIGLNPGPFSVKEHVLIYIIAGSAGGAPYGIDNVVGQKLFFGDNNVNLANSLLWVLCTQLVGYGIAGLMRRFLVKPTAMLWPAALSSVAFFNAFHNPTDLDDPNGKYFHTMSRYTAFWFAFCGMFLYHWIPSYFAPAIGAISLLCLFPNVSHTVAFLGSASGGPGILTLSFDWTLINQYGMVYYPWYTTVNFLVGGIFFGWIMGPIWYYTNPFNSPQIHSRMNFGGVPIADWNNATQNTDPFPLYNYPGLFDINGAPLSVSQGKGYPHLLDKNNNLNMATYEAAGETIFLTAQFGLGYYVSFMSLGAVLSHVALWYGKDVYLQFKDALAQTDSELYSVDPHYRIMQQYADIPEWMYLTFLAATVALTVVVVTTTPFVMPWWLCIICILTGTLFSIPIGIIQAITGYQAGLNILTELMAGLIVPGQTVAVAGFKSLGYNMVIQSLSLTGDLKFGYYMHISPIAMVACQLIGTLIGVFFNTFTALAMVAWKPVYPTDWTGSWSPNNYHTFVSAAGIWGALGPTRIFGTGRPYVSMNYAYLIGFLLPFLPWLANWAYPNKSWRKINFVLISAALISMPTGSLQIYIVCPVLAAFYVQFYLYRYHREFWNKYAWIVCIAFDTAATLVALSNPIFNLINPNLQGPADMFAPTFVGVGTGSNDYYCYGVDFAGVNWNTDVAQWAAAAAASG